MISIEPLCKLNWPAFIELFGKNGACGGCWCMLWRQSRSEFEQHKGDANKNLMKKIVNSGISPGVLAMIEGKAIGWCAFSQRENYPALDRSRIMKKVDEKPVWSVSCLFIAKPYRRKGISRKLLKGAISCVKQKGGKVLEAYPVEPKNNRMPDVFAWTGIASSYLKSGFEEVLRRSPTRPIMRYYI